VNSGSNITTTLSDFLLSLYRGKCSENTQKGTQSIVRPLIWLSLLLYCSGLSLVLYHTILFSSFFTIISRINPLKPDGNYIYQLL
jgi:hypothetical protein